MIALVASRTITGSPITVDPVAFAPARPPSAAAHETSETDARYGPGIWDGAERRRCPLGRRKRVTRGSMLAPLTRSLGTADTGSIYLSHNVDAHDDLVFAPPAGVGSRRPPASHTVPWTGWGAKANR